MKQIALATMNFESSRKKLPPGQIAAKNHDSAESFANTTLLPSLMYILPYMEQQQIYDPLPKNMQMRFEAFEKKYGPTGNDYNPATANQRKPWWAYPDDATFPSDVDRVLGQKIQTFICPSDNAETMRNPGSAQFTLFFYIVPEVFGGWWMNDEPTKPITRYMHVTNYLGCAGRNIATAAQITQPVDSVDVYKGAFRIEEQVALGDLRDGTSNTVLFGEVTGISLMARKGLVGYRQ